MNVLSLPSPHKHSLHILPVVILLTIYLTFYRMCRYMIKILVKMLKIEKKEDSKKPSTINHTNVLWFSNSRPTYIVHLAKDSWQKKNNDFKDKSINIILREFLFYCLIFLSYSPKPFYCLINAWWCTELICILILIIESYWIPMYYVRYTFLFWKNWEFNL